MIDSEERRKESADHEAGHYVIAFTECISHPPLKAIRELIPYITIELGVDPKGFGVGGTVATTDHFAPEPEKYSAFLLAGIAAQMIGVSRRNGWLKAEDIPLEVTARVWSGGFGDREEFLKRFGDGADILEHLGASCDLVTKHWGLIEILSDELHRRGSLFYEEPALILRAVGSEDRDFILEILDVYREHRASITTGYAYENFAARYPGREFKESLQALRERNPSIFEVEEDEEEGDEETLPPRVRDIILPIMTDVASAVVGRLAKKLKAKLCWP